MSAAANTDPYGSPSHGSEGVLRMQVGGACGGKKDRKFKRPRYHNAPEHRIKRLPRRGQSLHFSTSLACSCTIAHPQGTRRAVVAYEKNTMDRNEPA